MKGITKIAGVINAGLQRFIGIFSCDSCDERFESVTGNCPMCGKICPKEAD